MALARADIRRNGATSQAKRDRVRANAEAVIAALDRIEGALGETAEANAGKNDLNLAVRKLMRDSGVRKLGALGPA